MRIFAPTIALVRRISGLVSRFVIDRRGSFVAVFALSVLPLVTIAGAAVDLSQAVMVRARLAKAVDAAGLAAGAMQNASVQEIEETAQRFFLANYPATELGVPASLQVSVTDGTINLSANAALNTLILKSVGLDKMDVGVKAEVTREQRNIEVILVLDNTGSMAGSGKMNSMKAAATELVNILFGDDAFHPHLKVGLVPFVTSVNIKREGVFDMAWMDQNGEAAHHGINFENEDGDYYHNPSLGPVNHFALFDAVGNTDWKGCVEARPYPHDTQDTAPSNSNPDTKWVPYFWPDEPSSGGYNNNWINYPGPHWNKAEQQRDISHYSIGPWSIDETPKSTRGPNMSCPRPVLPLTNNKQQILEEIDLMEPHYNSGTNTALGLTWGWRLISPSAPFTEGGPFFDEDTQKVIVLLTDGHNVVVGQNNNNKSDYNGYNYLSNKILDTQNKWTAASKVTQRMSDVCEDVKALDVRLYTIVFMLNNNEIENTFRDCASYEQNYFNSPNGQDLKSAFTTIATDLTKLRISK
ncbi:MAG: pilus assembly protein [Pseudomonadota bacterium]